MREGKYLVPLHQPSIPVIDEGRRCGLSRDHHYMPVPLHLGDGNHPYHSFPGPYHNIVFSQQGQGTQYDM